MPLRLFQNFSFHPFHSHCCHCCTEFNYFMSESPEEHFCSSPSPCLFTAPPQQVDEFQVDLFLGRTSMMLLLCRGSAVSSLWPVASGSETFPIWFPLIHQVLLATAVQNKYFKKMKWIFISLCMYSIHPSCTCHQLLDFTLIYFSSGMFSAFFITKLDLTPIQRPSSNSVVGLDWLILKKKKNDSGHHKLDKRDIHI